MKRKYLSLLSGAVALTALLTACSGSTTPNTPPASSGGAAQSQTQPQKPAETEYKWDFVKKNAGIDDLKQECDQKGTVVELEYDTPAYAVNDIFGVEETLHKTMNIYLPYGYDESQQYNVLYLLHGTKGETDGPMEQFWLQQWGKYTTAVLDNMIKQGLCDPVIVACPNYYSEVEGYTLGEDEAKALSEKLGDAYLWSETAEDGGTPDNAQNIWPVYFGQELRNNIIPAVESAYRTYAGKDVSVENLTATRDHRAFAGLSRGSMTVTRAGMMTNTDLISYFGNYSGVWAEFDQFKSVMEGDFKDYPIHFWYNGNGKNDFALENHEAFKDKALEQMGDRFTDGESFAWVRLKDGGHMYNSWIVDLYNSLLVFF